MIQNYFEIEEFTRKYNESKIVGQLQKVYSTAHLICFVVRFPGKTRYIYWGRGGGYEGLWEGDFAPPAKLRVSDKLLQYLKKYLRGSAIVRIDIDPQDRIIIFTYENSIYRGNFLYFYHGRVSYFANSILTGTGHELFLSWRSLRKGEAAAGVEQCLERFDELGRGNMKHIARQREEIDFLAHYFAAQCTSGKVDGKKKSFLERKIERITQDLKKTQTWRQLQEHLEENKQIENEMYGHKFKFPADWSYYKRANLVHEKIKRLKVGEAILKQRLDAVQKELQELPASQYIKRHIVVPRWATKPLVRVEPEKKYNYDEFTISPQVKFAVGKDAGGNDYLRNKWASKQDWWFHIENHHGAHLVLKCPGLPQDYFSVVGSALNQYSATGLMQIPLIYAQVKYVKGVKGVPGKVMIKKPRYVIVEENKNWKEMISVN